jgi:hypothetical protein
MSTTQGSCNACLNHARRCERSDRIACAMVGLPQTVTHPAHHRLLVACATMSDTAHPA